MHRHEPTIQREVELEIDETGQELEGTEFHCWCGHSWLVDVFGNVYEKEE